MDYYRIQCDRRTASELLERLSQDAEAEVQLDKTASNLSGVVEVVTIMAGLTTIGVNILQTYIASRDGDRDRIKVEIVESRAGRDE